MAGRLAGMDADRRLRLVPLQRAAVDRPEVQRLSEERDLRRSLHVIDEAGRWASGGEAVLRIMERLPGLRPLACLARRPPLSTLVEPAYRLVADHRARFAWLAGSFVGDDSRRGQQALSGSARSPSRDRAGTARSRR
jgi:predicted DCC family thiol-disulfide oxidoreductase YuxK